MSDHVTHDHGTEAQAVAELAKEVAAPLTLSPDKTHHLVVPDDCHVHTVEIDERLLPAPFRIAGVYRPATVEAFVDYVANHEIPDHTTIWVDQSASTVLAILNDHAPGASAWRDHRALLTLAKTAEWNHWIGNDGKWLAQVDFAGHIQDGLAEVFEPDGATMLEIAQTMEGTSNASWKSATRLDNGEISLAYHEAVEATAGRAAHTEIPTHMQLRLAPFYGEEAVPVTARLRYRIRSGTLTIGYQLERPHDVVLEVLGNIANRLREKFPRVYLGSPA